jgi:hypothetical protein
MDDYAERPRFDGFPVAATGSEIPDPGEDPEEDYAEDRRVLRRSGAERDRTALHPHPRPPKASMVGAT